jgi:hypothetical protein
MRAGTDARVVRIRVIAAVELADGLAKRLAATLEDAGYELLEWSTPSPCKPPDDDKERIYLMGRLKGDGNGNGS